MNKKLLIAVSICLLLICVCFFFKNDTQSTAGVPLANENKIEKMKQKYEECKFPFSLFFNGEELAYDDASHTFFLPCDMYDEVWEEGMFTGKFIMDGKSEKASLFFTEDYSKTDKKRAVAEGTAFEILALSKRGYAEYKLVFSGMPIVSFHGTQYQADDGTTLFHMNVYDTDLSSDWVTDCYTQTELHGNTSLTYEKKSLKLKLKKKNEDDSFEKNNKNLLNLRNDDDWILNSLYADDSRIRDVLSIGLWKQTGGYSNPYGKLYGTDAKLVEVFINNAYQGIYALMVPIDAKQLGMDAVSKQIERQDSVIERIYKKKYTAEWRSSDFIGALLDPNAQDYRGGFYLKGDTLLLNGEEWKPLYRMAKLLEAGDSEFSAQIINNADQQNLIENWLFYQAIGGFDNENKNYYYVVRNKKDREYGYFIPWDLNISFGMVYADNEFYCERSDAVVNQPIKWQPAQRMIELNASDSKLILESTWKKWRNGVFSDENITKSIENLEYEVKASGAFEREMKRYPTGNQEEDFSHLYNFAINRLSFVDSYIQELVK